MSSQLRLAIVVSHPIQYYAPLFRTLAERCEIEVFYAFQPDADQLGSAGFGSSFEWDIDLLAGYRSTFMTNVSDHPNTDRFGGCDTPEIGNRLREGSFDAALIFGWYLKTHLQALWAAKRLRIPVMVRGDSNLAMPKSLPRRLAKAILNPAFLRVFDRALYVGERSRDFYRHYRYPEERLFFSPHCVDNAWFAARATPIERLNLRRELGISDGTFVVLFAGKLVGRKRPLDAVAALAACRETGKPVELLVAGSGELDQDIRIAARDAGLPLHMLGFRNQTQMPAVYAAADALVLPSDGNETWGLVANEALASGIPVIVSDACGCAPDLAADSEAGRMFALGDIDGLKKAIISIMEAPPSSQSIAHRIARYSLERAADGIENALESVRKVVL